jgi:WD40 repeat protein
MTLTHVKLKGHSSNPWFQIITRILICGSFSLITACGSSENIQVTEIPATQPPTARPSITIAPLNKTAAPPPSPVPGDVLALQFKPWEIIHDLAYSSDGRLFAVSAGEQVHIYDADALTLEFSLSPGAWTNRLAFHPSASVIALAVRDGSVQFWDTDSGALVCRFTAHEKGTNSLSINPEGTLLATTGTDITSRLWDISSVTAGRCSVSESGRLIGESFSSPDVAFAPDGASLALIDLTNIRLRYSTDRKLIALLSGDLPIFDLTFSPNGRWLAAAEHLDTVALWDISQPFKPTLSVLVPDGSNPKTHIWRVAFSPDSRFLAAGTSAGSLNVWDLSRMQLVTTYQLPRAVTALSFSPDGKILAAGGLDAQVWFFQVP